MKVMKNTLSTVSKIIKIAIGDCKAMIAIGDLFSNGDQDQDRDHDLKFEKIDIEIAITIFAIGLMP